jgi:hypothetical protein
VPGGWCSLIHLGSELLSSFISCGTVHYLTFLGFNFLICKTEMAREPPHKVTLEFKWYCTFESTGYSSWLPQSYILFFHHWKGQRNEQVVKKWKLHVFS